MWEAPSPRYNAEVSILLSNLLVLKANPSTQENLPDSIGNEIRSEFQALSSHIFTEEDLQTCQWNISFPATEKIRWPF